MIGRGQGCGTPSDASVSMTFCFAHDGKRSGGKVPRPVIRSLVRGPTRRPFRFFIRFIDALSRLRYGADVLGNLLPQLRAFGESAP